MYSAPASSHATSSYHTAHFGPRVDPNGEFKNFTRRADDSHKTWGYWCFERLEDERRAFNSHRHTPEDVLLTAARGENAHDDICLRWVSGTAETNLIGGISGNASFHLRHIYAIRRLLRKPAALRGHIPTYPIYPADKLKQYWDEWRASSRPQEHPAPVQAPTQAGASPALFASRTVSPTAQECRPLHATAQASGHASRRSIDVTDRGFQTQQPRTTNASAVMAPRKPPATGPQDAARATPQAPHAAFPQNGTTSGGHVPAGPNTQPRHGSQTPVGQTHAASAMQNASQRLSGQGQSSPYFSGTQYGSSITQPMQQPTPHHAPTRTTQSSYNSGQLQSWPSQPSQQPLPYHPPMNHQQQNSAQTFASRTDPRNQGGAYGSPYAPLTEGSANPQLLPGANITIEGARKLAKQYSADGILQPPNPPAPSLPRGLQTERAQRLAKEYGATQLQTQPKQLPSSTPRRSTPSAFAPLPADQTYQSPWNGQTKAVPQSGYARPPPPPANIPPGQSHMSMNNAAFTTPTSFQPQVAPPTNVVAVPLGNAQQRTMGYSAQIPPPMPAPGKSTWPTNSQEVIVIDDDESVALPYEDMPTAPDEPLEMPANPLKRAAASSEGDPIQHKKLKPNGDTTNPLSSLQEQQASLPPNVRSVMPAKTLKRPAATMAAPQRKKLKSVGQQPESRPPPQEQSRSDSFFAEYAGLACMDCGGDTEHTPDCHIGNLVPKTNLTVLDHRYLAECVARFDPGPWTTHYVPLPEHEEPEDPAVVVKEMADIVRKEDSYKDDEALHMLPDDLMLLSWALKTSENMEVVKREYDSGIGESEVE